MNSCKQTSNITFITKLRRLDKALTLRLDRVMQRYVVNRRDRRGLPRQILVIETPQGDFCYPNHNHIDQLFKMDMWQNKNMIKEMDAYNNSLSDDADREMHFLSEEMSKLATRSAFY